ncbi:MAG: GNAT family N-acetyltransferase [Ktedonobacterales bacterium]
MRAGGLDPRKSDPTEVIASTSATAAGGVGIIGNVAVHPEFRRRGLARSTTSAALEWLHQAGVQSVLLDATKDGQPLYTRLGFRPLAKSWYLRVPLRRLDRHRFAQSAGATWAKVHHARDLSLVRSLDVAAFGGDRGELLASMLGSPHNWLVIAGEPDSLEDEPSGYLVYGGLRDTQPSHAHPSIHIGPLVARNQSAAAALLAAVLCEDAPWRRALDPDVHPEVEIRASVPGISSEILAFYRSIGLPLHEDDLMMQLDLRAGFPTEGYESVQQAPVSKLPPYPGDPRVVYSWLAPMCF